MSTKLANFMSGWAGPRDEAEAMHVAAEGSRWERSRMAWRAGLALMLDTNDTQQVFYLAIAVDHERLPGIAQRLAAHPDGRELMRTRAGIDSKHVDFAALQSLPPDTLGGAYVRMLEAKGLDADFFQRPPGLPDELGYVAQRVRQTHDIWHVLTGLGTDIPGEIALQAFTFAQLGQHFSALIVGFGWLAFGLRYPSVFRLSQRAHRAGREAAYLLAVPWEKLWATPLADVRTQLRISPLG